MDWLPVFVSDNAFQIVTKSLNYCHRHQGLRTNAFVIMPTHFHAIFFHADFKAEPLLGALTAFRKFTGRQLVEYCKKHMPSCFRNAFLNAASNDRKFTFWQKTRHPEQIETERFWEQKFDYIHMNPCRKGFVRHASDWRYSSAAYWLSDGRVESEVLLSALEW
ncbi:MAG: hypothetical protein JW829_20470 [Pirellulales bacterium]|nr:hypothetical protein [Pirellulales bacterium]